MRDTPNFRMLIEALKLKLGNRRNMNRQKLASELKIAPSHLSDWISGKKQPSGENVLKLLEFMKRNP